MSRVDDARKRAAALASREASGLGSAEAVQLLPVSDIARLTVDAFPAEQPPGRRYPHVAPAPPPPPIASPPAQAPLPRLVTPNPPVEAPPTTIRPGGWGAPSSSPHPSLESIGDRPFHKFVVDPQMAPTSRERYRLLAAALHNTQTAKGVKVIMIASAVAGEGKTLTAANLALTFSESYHRAVLLIDADLRRPTLHSLFGEPAQDALEDLGDQKLQVRRVTPMLRMLTARSPSSQPMAELTSGQMQRLVQYGREAFDWVIIDTPPVTLLPDASLLASMVDGSVFVVRAESTPVELVQRAIEAIGKTNILGLVLNGATLARGNRAQDDQYYGRVTAADASRSE